MRSVAAAAVLLGAGLVAGHALADTVPVPGADGLRSRAHGPRSGAQGDGAGRARRFLPQPVPAPAAGSGSSAPSAPTVRFFGRLGRRDGRLDPRELDEALLLLEALLSGELRLVERKPARAPADQEPPHVADVDFDLRAEAPTGHDAHLRASARRAGGPGRQAGLADVPGRRAVLRAGARWSQPSPLSRKSKAPAARGRHLPDHRAHSGRETPAARDDRRRRGRNAKLE